MRDQAAGLRALKALEPQATPDGPPEIPVVVLGSGKGGVGKSLLSVLLASALAREGRRVLLFDAAQNHASLHLLLGVRPASRPEALLRGEVEPEDLLTPVADKLWLLPADSGSESVHALTAVDRARLHYRLGGLYDRFDAVVVDAGPGIESVVRATMRATLLAAVVMPEPASLSDAYALVKIVNQQTPTLPVGVIVNRTADEDEGREAFSRVALAAGRFLRRDLEHLGSIAESDVLRRAVRTPGALLGALAETASALAARVFGAHQPAGTPR